MLVTWDGTGNLGDKDNGDSETAALLGNDSSIEKPSNESILIVIRSPASSAFQPLKITRYTEALRFKSVDKNRAKNRGRFDSRRSIWISSRIGLW